MEKEYLNLDAGHDQKLIGHLILAEEVAKNKLGILHDLGKVSYRFQKKLKGENNKFRHPIAILPVVDFIMRELNYDDTLRKIYLFCVYFHHSSFNYDMVQNDIIKLNSIKNITEAKEVILNEKEVRLVFDIINDNRVNKYFDIFFDVNKFFDFLCFKDSDFEQKYLLKLKDVLKELYLFGDEIDLDIKNKIINLYGNLIKGDWYSSKKKRDFVDWDHLRNLFYSKFNYLKSNFVKNDASFVKDEVQNTAYLEKNNKVILSAPTGAGKTEASLMWALDRAKENNAKTIIYVLPFKNLIDDLYNRFSRYFFEEGRENVIRWHSDWIFDELERIESKNIKYISFSEFNINKAFRSNFLNANIIITTADQIISSFLNVKRYAIRYNIFRESVFVFDEIQGYDAKMKAILYEFIKQNCKSCMVMTATLPGEIEFALGSNFKIITKESWWKAIRKTTNAKVSDEIFIYNGKNIDLFVDEILSFKNNVKNKPVVCIITNTVNKSIEISKKIKERLKSWKVDILNSVVLYDDRIRVIKEVKNKSFDEYDGYILVSTQVIEAGVDLSFDLMFRELAPISSLVQSVGRLHRSPSEDNNRYKVVFFYTYDDKKKEIHYHPYDFDEIKRIKEILESNIKNINTKDELESFLNGLDLKDKKEYLEVVDFIKYITSLSNKVIWSVSSVEDLLGDSLRDEFRTERLFVYNDDKDLEKIERKELLWKEIKEKTKQSYDISSLIKEYVDLSAYLQRNTINVYSSMVKKYNKIEGIGAYAIPRKEYLSKILGFK